MANRRRGDVHFEFGGRTLTLRLTLGALAEMEAALGAGDLTALGERFGTGRFSARDIAAVLGAAARGGGETVGDAELADGLLAADLPGAMRAVAALLAASFGEGGGESAPRPSRPPAG